MLRVLFVRLLPSKFGRIYALFQPGLERQAPQKTPAIEGWIRPRRDPVDEVPLRSSCHLFLN